MQFNETDYIDTYKNRRTDRETDKHRDGRTLAGGRASGLVGGQIDRHTDSQVGR